MTRARDLADYISTGVSDTELDVLDGVTAGTVTASKALVVDANKDIATIRNITSSGTITGVTSLTVDDITIDGSTISDGGDLTLDVAGDLILDSDAPNWRFKDNGTSILEIGADSQNPVIYAAVADKDIQFKGSDGGSTVTALTLDMSDAGSAIFNNHVYISDSSKLQFGAASDLQIYHDTSHSIIEEAGTGALKLKGDDIRLEDTSGNNIIKAVGSGSAELYEAGNKKLETTANGINVTGDVVVTNDIYVSNDIIHEGDADTKIGFDTNQINIVTNNTTTAFTDSGIFISDGSLAEDYDALSGTTPTCNVDNGAMFSLTTSGNTTFTFSGASSGYVQGFTLQLTAGGTHTITYPNSVDFAGGSAPDAPASGETDVLVFITRDGGTTWYGALAIDAAG